MRDLGALLSKNSLSTALYNSTTLKNTRSILFAAQPTKRKTFFSFHFDDIMRVNNVRQAWKIHHSDSALRRSFQDSSLWENKQLEGDDAIKKLIRQGVEYTSAVCVLIGSHTHSRRWVKYEIARSVIDSRGLLSVHINSLNHHEHKRPDPLGDNPLHLMGIYKSTEGKFFLYEKRSVKNLFTGQIEEQWCQYQDYKQSVPLPRYLIEPPAGYIRLLSAGTIEYDFVSGKGHTNIGAWIDQAALKAGR